MPNSPRKNSTLGDTMIRDCANPQKVQAFLKSGVDVNYQNRDTITVLLAACVRGHIATVDFLIKHGADLNLPQEGGMTALMKAALWNHPKLVQKLVDAGADVNAKTNCGATALHHAHHLEIAKILVAAGAEMNARSAGATSLDRAKAKGNAELISFLKSHGAV